MVFSMFDSFVNLNFIFVLLLFSFDLLFFRYCLQLFAFTPVTWDLAFSFPGSSIVLYFFSACQIV